MALFPEERNLSHCACVRGCASVCICMCTVVTCARTVIRKDTDIAWLAPIHDQKSGQLSTWLSTRAWAQEPGLQVHWWAEHPGWPWLAY